MARKRDITQLKDIDEPCTSINIHGAVTNISPVKKGRKSLFFDGTLADTTSKVRLIGFSPQQQILLNDLHKASSPVELSNCEVKHSRQGQGYDIMLKSNTQIKKSPKKIDMDTIMATSTLESVPITLDAIPSTLPYEKVSVNIKVIQLFRPEEVGQEKKVKKRDALIADHTATTKVVLWEPHLDALEQGKCYNLKDFQVKEFQSKKHLSMPRNNFKILPIDYLENTVPPPPEENESTTIHDVQIIGVSQLDIYKSCLQCKARVEPQTPPMGKCTKGECLMMQLYDLCQDQIVTRVLLRHLNDKGHHETITCSAFGDMVYQLAGVPKTHNPTITDLLKCQQMNEMQFLTDKKIITFILRQI